MVLGVGELERPSYLTWVVKEEGVVLDNEEPIHCYRLDYVDDDAVFDDWALHIRRHFISDEELKKNCRDLEMTLEEYLKQNVIPQKGETLAGTARSNYISEILFSDLMEFVNGLEVPRYRLDNMSGKTVSEHGTDIIGFKFFNKDKKPNEKDILFTIEVKAGLTQQDATVIKRAVIDADKDEYRLAQSLDYMRRKLERMGKVDEANDTLRFQKKTKTDYEWKKCAAGMSSLCKIPEIDINGRIVKVIPNISGEELKGKASIYFVHGKRLMDLAHNVFDRCVR